MRQKIKLKDQTSLSKWSLDEARELYNIPEWGQGFFDINDKGNMVVLPEKNKQRYLDIKEFVDGLCVRDLNPPVLIRFTDILQKRIEEIQTAFQKAIVEYNYGGKYFGVYPVKVNQSKQVVEDIVDFGKTYNFGLEAGTKAELLIVLASMENLDAPVICNGYKDDEYIEMALWATKLGRKVIIVVEKPSELDLIIRWAKKLQRQAPHRRPGQAGGPGAGQVGELAAATRASSASSPAEILDAVEKLKAAKMLDCLQLLHFHLGSQITSIQSIKEALRESTRFFVELVRLGVNIRYFDVGGGLAVDYDGSKTNFSSSANYSIEEYASDVVSSLAETCEEEQIPHPHIISESGRALVAYHSVLVFNVLGTSKLIEDETPPEIPDDAPEPVHALNEVLNTLSVKNFQESYHDAIQIRDETLTLFNVGMMSLAHRALVERLFWLVCLRIAKIIHTLDYVPGRTGEPGPVHLRHLLREPLGVPEPARPLGRETALPHLPHPPPQRAAHAQGHAGGHHLRQRRQDRPVHRPARREEHHRPARVRREANPTTSASSSWAPTRRPWATCTTSSGTRTPSTSASRGATSTRSTRPSRATRCATS